MAFVFDPSASNVRGPAWEVALAKLADGRWHPTAAVKAVMVSQTDIRPTTAANLLKDAVRHGVLERRGEWSGRQFDPDTREIRLNN